MSNWSGVYANDNSVGTSTGANGSNTLNDTGASWPDLINQYVQITAGTGIGQERRILSTLPTQITIVGTWDIVPDDTSQYKIILRLDDGDHIVATTYFYPGTYSELEDNATIYIDGSYRIIIGDATEISWNKTKETLVTFEANNRDVQGRYGFWLGILYDNIATGVVKLSCLRIRDASQGLQIEPGIAFGDGSDVHHIIFEECSSYPFAIFTTAITQDVVIRNILVKKCDDNTYFNLIDSIYSLTYENFWLEGDIYFGGKLSARNQIFKNNVVLGKTSQATTINNTDKKVYIIDNYLNSNDKDVYFLYPGAGEEGNIYFSRNVSKLGRELINGSLETDMKIYSKYNDYLSKGNQTYYAIEDLVSGAETLESDNDFISGRKLGIDSNTDLTELITSNHTPPMYKGLSTARANAKLTYNKLLELDNIIGSDLTNNSIKIKFDCKNSHAGTTVDQDSASGQLILYTSDTTDFEIEETIEIGFGTARQEEGVIDSIQASISITLKENLTYTHTQAQGDTVKKRLRNLGLGFIKYGISADNLNLQTYVPNKNSWGYLFNGFIPEIITDDGYEWKYTDFEIDITELDYSTTYYFQTCAFTPLGDLMTGGILNFTTLSADIGARTGVLSVGVNLKKYNMTVKRCPG